MAGLAGAFGNQGYLRRLALRLLVAALGSACSSVVFANAVGTLPGQFSVSPTGAATYRIPIEVVPGANGVQPSLALLYNSQKGDGVAGVGWSLQGLSAISRCPATKASNGDAEAVDPTNTARSDQFCLDGQHLLLMPGSSDYGTNSATYHTEIASFQRVTSYGTQGNGPAWFEVSDKAGLTREYGHTTDSAVTATALNDTTSVVVWNVDKVSDQYGNYIQFIYDEDHQISAVKYFNNSGTMLGAVTFSRGSPHFVAYYTYFAGAVFNDEGDLDAIDVYSGSEISDATHVRHYKLVVQDASSDISSAMRTLTSVQECDSTGNDCFPATKFTYSSTPVGFGAETPLNNAPISIHWADVDGDGRPDMVYADSGTWKIRFAATNYQSVVDTQVSTDGEDTDNAVPIDYDGDGYQGLLIPAGSDYWVIARSNGSTLLPWNGPAIENCGTDDHPVVADIDGDGLPEILFKCPTKSGDGYYNIDYHENAGGYTMGYGTLTDPGGTPIEIGGGEQLIPVNVNGDGRADLLIGPGDCGSNSYCEATRNEILVAEKDPSTGSTVLNFMQRFADATTVVVADVNGDGLGDAIVYGPYPDDPSTSGYQAYLNHGGWFGEHVGTSFKPSGYGAYFDDGGDVSTLTPGGALTLDYNQDGKADLLVPATTGTWVDVVWVGGPLFGGTFAAVDTGIPSTSYDSTHIVDTTGYGLGDMVYPSSGWKLRTQEGWEKSGLLTGVTNGLGAQLSIDYCTTEYCKGTNYAPDSTPRSPDAKIRNFNAPLYVVTQITTDSGDGSGATLSTSYSYTGAKFGQWGRGFLGFESVQATNEHNITTKTSYRLDFPYTGLATSFSQSLYGSSNAFVTTVNVLTEVTDDRYGRFPYIQTATQTNLKLGDHTPYKQVQTTYTYDACGNATDTKVETTGGGDTYTIDTENKYSDVPATGPCLGRLVETDVAYSWGGKIRNRKSTFTYQKGQLESETTTSPDAADGLTLATTYGFDTFGNRNSKTVTGTGIASRTTKTQYDPTGRFPVETWDALGHPTTMTWDTRLGVKTQTVDPNGVTINYKNADGSPGYDAFGRLIHSTGPFPGSQTNISYSARSGGGYVVTTTQAGGETTTAQYDDKGREVLATHTGLNGQVVYQETHYDLLGRPYLVSAPYYQGQTRCWTYTEYDPLNRPTAVYRPASDDECTNQGGAIPDSPPSAYYSAVVETVYKGLITDVTTPNGTTETTDNLLGKPANVTEALGNAAQRTTTYTYWPAGNLESRTQPTGTVAMTYDDFGNKLTTSSSTSGDWSYGYDALGELTSQSGPNGNITTQGYDLLGRLTQRVEPDVQHGGTITTSWEYDDSSVNGIGKLTHEYDSNGFDRKYTYTTGAAGSQLQDVTTTVDGTAYTVTRTYDDYGRLSSLSYPDSAPPPVDAAAPVAEINASAMTVAIGTAVTLDASGSSDADNGPQPLAYLWQQTGGADMGVNGSTDASVTFTPTVPGNYSFQVQVGDGQLYDTSEIITITATPKTPVLQSILPNPSTDGRFTITWDGTGTGASDYTIYEQAQPYLGEATSPSYPNEAGPTASFTRGNGDYTFQVAGCAPVVGCSPTKSNSVKEHVTLPPGAPGAPTFYQDGQQVTAAIGPTNGPATVTLNWAAATGKVTSTTLYQLETLTGTITNPPFSGTSATVTFTSDRTNYQYWVEACNETVCRSSPKSNITSYFKPGTPGSFSIAPNPNDGPYTLTWSKPPGSVVSYKLLQSVNGGAYTQVTSPPIGQNDTSVSLSNWTNGATYSYQLYAENGPAESATPAQGSVTVYLLPAAPASVTVPAKSNASGDFTVSWSGSTYATYYKAQAGIYDYELKTYHWLGTPVSVGNTTSHTFHQSDGEYYYRVQACNHVDSICSVLTQSTSSVTVLNAPGIPSSIAASPTAVNSDQSYTISWGAASGSVTNYQLQEDLQDSTFASPTTFNMGTARSKAFSHYNSGTPRLHDHYYYRVRACNSAGCSGWRATASVTVTATFSGGGGGGGGTCPPTCTQVVGPTSLSAPTTTTTPSTDGGPLSLNMPHMPVLAPLPPASANVAPITFGDNLRIDRPALAIAPAVAVTTGLLAATRGVQAAEPVIPHIRPVRDDRTLIAHAVPPPVTTRPAPRLAVAAAANSGASARDQSSGLRLTSSEQVAALHTAAWNPETIQTQGRGKAAIFRYAPTAGAWYRQLKLKPAAMTTDTTTTGYRLTLHYNYDAYGHVVQVYGPDPTHPYWTAQSADAMGHVELANVGTCNGGPCIGVARTYDRATGALRGVSAGWACDPSNPASCTDSHVQFAEYTYDASGNLDTRTDHISNQTEIYTNDALNRLTQTSIYLGGGQTGTLTAAYDSGGNLTSRNGEAYTYDPSHPNRLQTYAGSAAYLYDNAGRILTGSDQLSVGWTAFGKPYTITRSVEGQSHQAQFWYGPEHVRYKQVVDGTEEISLEGGAYQVMHDVLGTDYTYKMAILVGGAVVGQIQTSTNSAETGKTHYFYAGVRGSVAVITDGQGNVTSRMSYGPYGAKRDTTNWNNWLSVTAILSLDVPTDRGFTGQHDLTGMKLVDYGGRIYDLETARFLSPDPTGAEYNPYAYVGNNPETFTDPTGYFRLGDFVANAFMTAVIIVASIYTGGAAADAAGGIGTLGGAMAGGATGGFTSGFLGSDGSFRAGFIGALDGAAMGGIGYGFGNNVSGDALVAKSVAEGAVGGLLSEAAGGNFGDGFLGAFSSSMAGPWIDKIPGEGAAAEAERVAASAALGGTVSALNGGSFANGAVSAAFQQLFNDHQEREKPNAETLEDYKKMIAAANTLKAKIDAMSESQFKAAFPEIANRDTLPDMDLWKLNMEEDLANVIATHMPEFVHLYVRHVGVEFLKQVVSRGYDTFFTGSGTESEMLEHQLDMIDQANSIINDSSNYRPVFACGVYSGCQLVH